MPHTFVRVPTVLAALGAAALALPAHAQTAPVQRLASPPPTAAARQQAAQQARDSVRSLRRARSAQSEFERVRFNELPWTFDSGHPDRCDEIVGRFCFWFGDKDEEKRDPPPEAKPVGVARGELVSRLARAAAEHPGDEWVTGQLVRYQVEARRADDALATARACRATAWWCGALTGYALHARGDYAAAEAAFDAALASMPQRRRHDWTDLGLLLSPGERRQYNRMRPAQRDSVERVFWRLADPMVSTPGNEARTEHLSRWVMARLNERAQSTDGLRWGSDLGEFLLRYGPPDAWERVRQPMPTAARANVVSHYASHAWSFIPRLRDLANPSALKPDGWEPDPDQPRVQYPVGYARSFEKLEPQVAVFRRGGQAVVLAAYDMDADSVPAASPVSNALVLDPGTGHEPIVVRGTAAGATGVLRADAVPAPALLSLEVRADSVKRAGRARFGLPLAPPPATGIHLSDILLLTRGDSLPSSLEEATPLARGTYRVKPGERLGLFWEVYGLASQNDTLALGVSIARTNQPGFARRAAERIGLASRGTPVKVGWKEESGGRTILGRSLAVTLPDLSPGEYSLQVSVQRGAEPPVLTTRKLIVPKPR